MKVLLLGRDGQVGSVLTQVLAPLGEIVAYGREGADFTRPTHVTALFERHRPDVVINAVAYTAVDKAESEAAVAQQVNCDTPALLAGAAAAAGVWFIHYSTDYVFDGTKRTPYVEDDVTNPLSVYGRTKRDGELAIAAAGGRQLILRTSWVHSPGARNFIATILQLASQRSEIDVVADQSGSPTSARLIAETTLQIIERIGDDRPPEPGIYHLTASGETSRCEYARFIVAGALARGARLRLSPDAIHPINSSEAPTPARRPGNCHLSNLKLARFLGQDLPRWEDDAMGTIAALAPGYAS